MVCYQVIPLTTRLHTSDRKAQERHPQFQVALVTTGVRLILVVLVALVALVALVIRVTPMAPVAPVALAVASTSIPLVAASHFPLVASVVWACPQLVPLRLQH